MDSTILRLPERNLPDDAEVWVPAVSSDGKIFRFEFKERLSSTIEKNTRIVNDALSYLSADDAILIFNGEFYK